MPLHDLHLGFWQALLERRDGPFAFRLVLQPAMTAFFAIRDGWHDAAMHRPPYLWTICHDRASSMPLLHEGLRAVCRVLVLAAGMDLLYQVVALHDIRPLETLLIALLLAFLPYLIVRGPAARIGRAVIARREQEASERSRTH